MKVLFRTHLSRMSEHKRATLIECKNICEYFYLIFIRGWAGHPGRVNRRFVVKYYHLREEQQS